MRARLVFLALFLITCCLAVGGCCKDCPPPNTGNAGSGGGGPVGRPVTFTGKRCVGPTNVCTGSTGDPCTQFGSCVTSNNPRVCAILLNPTSECRTGEAAPCMTVNNEQGVYVCNPLNCKWDTNACKPCGQTNQQCCLGSLRCPATDSCEGDPAFPSTGVCKTRT